MNDLNNLPNKSPDKPQFTMKFIKMAPTLALALSVSGMMSAQAQQADPPPPGGSYNPYLVQGFVTPAPMLPAEFNGTGQLVFDVGNTGSDTIVWVTGQEMLITISLSRGKPNVTDPEDALDAINAIGGPGSAFFSWSYNPLTRTFRATQAADLPPDWRETITIDYKVTENSFSNQTFQNGYNANIAPPGYTAGQAVDDDALAAYTFVEAFDYGDAPASYGVVSHAIDLTQSASGYNRYIYLGNFVDPEDAMQYSSDATGDDVNQTGGLGVNDEDAVVFPTMIPGSTVDIPVTITVMDQAGFNTLNAWIDWNGNGQFDPVEQIATNEFALFTGTQTINVSVPIPSDAVPGLTFARFRLGTSDLSPTGTAQYGEVEDYQIQLQQLLGSISGTVSADTDGSGTGNVLVEGIVLSLLDGNGDPVLDGGGQAITTTTDSNGNYLFENVAPGNYQVAKTPSGTYVSLSDADGGDPDLIGSDTLIAVVGGEENIGNDFLEFLQACADIWTDWQAEWNTELGGQTAPDQNPDGDRYSNLIEHAFCLPPNSGEKKPFCLFSSTSVIGAVDGIYRRTAIGGSKDVTYVLEWSATLGTPTQWDNSVVLVDSALIVENNGDGTENVIIPDIETFTGLTAGSGFVRIRVDLNDGTTVATDHTDVLGWVETAFPLGATTYNNPFLECAVFTGTVNSVNQSELSLPDSANGANLGDLLDPSASYHIEVEAGDFDGHRFDVGSAGIDLLGVPNDTNAVGIDAPFNTIAGALPVDIAGDRIAVHRSKTLDMLFPPSAFGATADQSTADQLQFFADGQWRIYWLYDDGVTPRWVDADDANLEDKGDTVVPPGRGMFFINRTAPINLVAFGEVRPHGFVNPLANGNNLVGGGYPLDQTPRGGSSRELNLADGFFGSRDFKTADSVFRWRRDNDTSAVGYDTYFLLSHNDPSVESWILQTDVTLTSQDASTIFERDRAVFQRVRDGFTGYRVPAPWVANRDTP